MPKTTIQILEKENPMKEQNKPTPEYMTDDKGRLVPVNTIKPQRLLEDQVVAKITGYAIPLSEQLGRFKAHTIDDIQVFIETLAEEYGVKKGGAKGNVTITSFDGLQKVVIAQADLQDFGPELQVAKQIFDDVVNDIADDVNDHIMALVNRAFEVGKKGRVNRESLLKVRDLKIDHPKWPEFQQAVNDSIRTISSKEYVRVYTRPDINSQWQAVPLHIANAGT